ncbi:MAG: ABC transporter permease [Clostridiales bacterium]|jgi:putative ABC transport system permease protein|nr:ABC transporter permease [Clostridiales bacterium]
MNILNILLSTTFQGFIYSVVSLGVYITFRILNFADMTVEGSLTLGGSVCAVMILNGINPILSTIIAGLVGSLAGSITGFLNTKLKIQAILSGILTMISLYSVNIRIMGKANISLLGKTTIFKELNQNFIIGLLICVFLILILYLFFKTRLGLAICMTGDNEQMMKSQGANTDLKKIFALSISNFFCGISGALIAQSQGYADVNMGIGTLVIALSSIVIGETIFRKKSILIDLIAVVLGSIIYRFIIYFVLNLGMKPSDLKLLTAIIATFLLALPNIGKDILKGFKNVKN